MESITVTLKMTGISFLSPLTFILLLINLFSGIQGSFRQLCSNPHSDNPKLKRLEKIILDFYDEDKSAQGILFCKTRETTTALMNWMKENSNLAWLNPHNLVGSKSPQRLDGIA